MMNLKDVYRTKDLGEAAALYSVGVKLLGLDSEDNFFWFVFENDNAPQIANEYWAGDLVVNAKGYNSSYQTLKDRIFSRKSNPRMQ